MNKAAKFMERHELDVDYKLNAIEKWEINSALEFPEEVWEYERTRIDKSKRWVSSKERNASYEYEKAV